MPDALLEHGLAGLVIGGLAVAYRQKDQYLTTVRDAYEQRVAELQEQWRRDVAEMSERMLAITRETNEAIDRLAQVSSRRVGSQDMTR